jgi:hypothetical protein
MYEKNKIDYINVLKFNGHVTDHDITSLANDIESLFNKKEPFYIILDVLEISNFNFDFLKKFDRIFNDELKVRMYLKGSVILTSNKKILNFILSFRKPLIPTIGSNSYNEGINFLNNIKNI